MKHRRDERTGFWLLLALLCGALGYWLGLRSGPAADATPVVTLVQCPDVVGCGEPPSVTASKPPRPPPVKTRTTKNGRELPDLDGEDPDREKLLAYIRERSSVLRDCASNTPERVNLTMQLVVDSNGTVRRARVVTPERFERGPASCVESRMTGWTLPGRWRTDEQSLLVAVVL